MSKKIVVLVFTFLFSAVLATSLNACGGASLDSREQGVIITMSPNNGATPTHVEQKLLTGQILAFYTTNLLGLLSTSTPATEDMYNGVMNQTTVTPKIGYVT